MTRLLSFTAALLLGLGATRSSHPAICYRFENRFFLPSSDSTVVIALEQEPDTSAAPPFDAPTDALPVEMPLSFETTDDAARVLDRSWWHRLSADSVEIDIGGTHVIRAVARRDSLIGRIARLEQDGRPRMGRPPDMIGVRTACPAMPDRPGGGSESVGSFDDYHNIEFFLDGVNLAGAAIFYGSGGKFPRSPARRAYLAAAYDSNVAWMKAALRHGTGGGGADELSAYASHDRTAYVEHQTFKMPERRAVLAILVDLTDSVGGRPRILLRRIKYNSAADSVIRDSRGLPHPNVVAFDRVLRSDSVVRAFLERKPRDR